ncbi:MAG: hypothetical protein ACXVJ7_15530 [Acidimicrobiia bacterium]
MAGAFILLSPFFLDRLKTFSVNATGFEMELTESIAALGAPGTAAAIAESGLSRLAESYEFAHEELGDEFIAARIHLQDTLVDKAAGLARRQRLDAGEVRLLFQTGSPLQRVLTLGLFEGDPALVDGRSIVSAVTNSRTGNEQYHGLKLAEAHWARLKGDERRSILVTAKNDERVRNDADRREIADRLLARG